MNAPPRARKRAPTSFGSVLAEVENGERRSRQDRPAARLSVRRPRPAHGSGGRPDERLGPGAGLGRGGGRAAASRTRARRAAASRTGRAARRAGRAAFRRSRRHRRRTGLERRADARRSEPRAAALHVGEPSRSSARRAARARQSPGGDRQHAARPRRGGARGESATRLGRGVWRNCSPPASLVVRRREAASNDAPERALTPSLGDDDP